VPLIADLRDKMIDPARLVCVADWLLCCGEGVQRFAVEGSFPVERTRLSPIPFKIPDIPSHEQVCEVRRRYGLDRGSYILFVGDITYNKGVYDLLEAFRHWRSRHPGVQLALAGVNREGDQFWDQLKQAPGATYLGHVPHGDALTLMCAAEIVALPSRSEGLPRVILEAVALGTKVICPPGIPEFELHLPQFVLPTVSSSSICDMLELVWHTDQGPNYPLSNHDVDRIVQDLANVYREAI
jgi:glycosyltransferase involved in cell wall biosynthesis